MREILEAQQTLGQVPIEDIEIDSSSRDEMPAVLRGLKFIFCNQGLRSQIFALIDEQVLKSSVGKAPSGTDSESGKTIDPHTGRPGMSLWMALVFALVKQALNCDFDRLCDEANQHKTLRIMLGVSPMSNRQFHYRTLARNVKLFSAELLEKINRLVAEAGHRLAGWQPGDPIKARCDTWVVETNVEYPTDYRLLWFALVQLVKTAVGLSYEYHVVGWRKAGYWQKRAHRGYRGLRREYRKQSRTERVRDFARVARAILKRGQKLEARLEAKGAAAEKVESLRKWVRHAARQLDQMERRLLREEKIPNGEKVYSFLEEYTRWVSKGKAGTPVELGVPVAIVESRDQFVMECKILWTEQDVEVTGELLKKAKRHWPEMNVCSFDKGFSSVQNIKNAAGVIETPVLPKRGKLSKADREREDGEAFKEARKQHPGVESAINRLEHHGLDRVREKGKEVFEKVVWRAILAANVHRIGKLLNAQEQAQRKRQAKRRPKAA